MNSLSVRQTPISYVRPNIVANVTTKEKRSESSNSINSKHQREPKCRGEEVPKQFRQRRFVPQEQTSTFDEKEISSPAHLKGNRGTQEECKDHKSSTPNNVVVEQETPLNSKCGFEIPSERPLRMVRFSFIISSFRFFHKISDFKNTNG